jgi:hypothetical protein
MLLINARSTPRIGYSLTRINDDGLIAAVLYSNANGGHDL